ncbi:MAG: hypothetical protein WC505_07995 [Patescibacteria group bacterium]
MKRSNTPVSEEIKAFADRLRATSFSQARLAWEARVSTVFLNKLLLGKYPHAPKQITRDKLRKALVRLERQAKREVQ